MANEKKATENQVVDFDEQLKAERAFYLRKTDNIPGTNVSLEDARANHRKVEEKFAADNFARAKRVSDRLFETSRETVNTSVVVPGINVDIKAAPVVSDMVNIAQFPALPSDEELKKMKSADLIALAEGRGVEVKANVDTEGAIIARLKGTYTDARFAPLVGRSREVLDGYAVELGLGVDADDLKAKYANSELLSGAIESFRKTGTV